MKICNECDTQYDDSVMFCPKDGIKLTPISDTNLNIGDNNAISAKKIVSGGEHHITYNNQFIQDKTTSTEIIVKIIPVDTACHIYKDKKKIDTVSQGAIANIILHKRGEHIFEFYDVVDSSVCIEYLHSANEKDIEKILYVNLAEGRVETAVERSESLHLAQIKRKEDEKKARLEAEEYARQEKLRQEQAEKEKQLRLQKEAEELKRKQEAEERARQEKLRQEQAEKEKQLRLQKEAEERRRKQAAEELARQEKVRQEKAEREKQLKLQQEAEERRRKQAAEKLSRQEKLKQEQAEKEKQLRLQQEAEEHKRKEQAELARKARLKQEQEAKYRQQRLQQEAKEQKFQRSAMIRLAIVAVVSMAFIYQFIFDGRMIIGSLICVVLFIASCFLYVPDIDGKFWDFNWRFNSSTLYEECFGDDKWWERILYIGISLFFPFIIFVMTLFNVIIYLFIFSLACSVVLWFLNKVFKFIKVSSSVYIALLGSLFVLLCYTNIKALTDGSNVLYLLDSEYTMTGIEYKNGATYTGDMECTYFNCIGTPFGEGRITWPNGEYYIGEWKHGNMNGHGTWYLKDGTVKQRGIWKNNQLVDTKRK